MVIYISSFVFSAACFLVANAEISEIIGNAEISMNCDFSVRRDGPDGELVSGATLDSVLYYGITCDVQPGYCLIVANCTVTPADKSQQPYPVIDENGCSLDDSLYEHVQYRSSNIAGILNPTPIRFRSSSAAVILHCDTSMRPTTIPGMCKRFECNEI